MRRNTAPEKSTVLKSTLRAPEVSLLQAFGEPVLSGLRISSRVAKREIEKRRREIAAFERLSSKGVCWDIASK